MKYRCLSERQEVGREARERSPWAGHAEWSEAPDRSDPIDAIVADDEGRIDFLIPLRHARMLATPFTFYRGSASVMAADLAATPTSGIDAQLCGDAHLSNFGLFASPARRMVFDVNDFDETLPGPWEWDVKRLAASFVLAGRNNGFDAKTSRKLARRSVREYQRAMHDFAQMSNLEVWYTRLLASDLRSVARKTASKKKVDKALAKARRRDRMQALSKWAVEVDGEFRIAADPPIVIPLWRCPRTDGSRAGPRCRPGSVRRLPRLDLGFTARVALPVPTGRLRSQGGRRRECGDEMLHGAVRGPRHGRSAVPPGEGGRRIGARDPSRSVEVRRTADSGSSRASG